MLTGDLVGCVCAFFVFMPAFVIFLCGRFSALFLKAKWSASRPMQFKVFTFHYGALFNRVSAKKEGSH